MHFIPEFPNAFANDATHAARCLVCRNEERVLELLPFYSLPTPTLPTSFLSPSGTGASGDIIKVRSSWFISGAEADAQVCFAGDRRNTGERIGMKDRGGNSIKDSDEHNTGKVCRRLMIMRTNMVMVPGVIMVRVRMMLIVIVTMALLI